MGGRKDGRRKKKAEEDGERDDLVIYSTVQYLIRNSASESESESESESWILDLGLLTKYVLMFDVWIDMESEKRRKKKKKKKKKKRAYWDFTSILGNGGEIISQE